MAVAVLIAIAVLQAHRPPVLDLPQLLGQAKSLVGLLRGEEPDLQVVWTAPNKLGYLPILGGWLLGGESWAPRLAMLLTALFWLGGLHAISALARRPVESTLLASTLVLNSSFYGGFVNSLVGLAAAAFWVWELGRDPGARPWFRIAAGTCVGSLLLYYSHALWFVLGGFAVATWVLLFRFSWREVLSRALGVLPVVLLGMQWSPLLRTSGWQTSMVYGAAPLERMTSLWKLTAFAYGGIHGALEQILMVVLLGWLILGAIRAVLDKGAGVDRFLLIVGLVCLAAAFFGPERLDKTMLFAPRWGAPGFAVLCLALPAPRWPARVLATIALSACLVQSTWTAALWARHGRIGMAGFDEVLEAVPRGAAVFPMDLVPQSRVFMLSPFVQLCAYAALERDAEIPFRFSGFITSLVVQRDPREMEPWRDLSAWNPYSVTRSQLEGFDYLLLHAEPRVAGTLVARVPEFSVVRQQGDWSLISIDSSRMESSVRSIVGEVLR